ncbi:MAG: hypothetical protein A2Z45_01705 [Chloroflexi bacterium RBG_19FT_COMBO_55_16]|nr:MAG: hypothetical protein A2Z45_01705 [Chloroflexi bacterium RBG_19FT_COMBO_55_16]
MIGILIDKYDKHVGHWQPDVDSIEISDVHLHLPRLAPEFEGYRLVQISDIHLGTWMNKASLDIVVDKVNQLTPDLVAITGDFVSFAVEDFANDLIGSLRRLTPKDACVAILGNHDYWTNPNIIRWVLNKSTITDLSNTVFSILRQEACLHLVGIDDFLINLDKLGRVLDQLPDDGAAILLAHEPDFADVSAASRRFDLQLSGHTHGGQIVLPFLGRLILPSRGQKYPSGRYLINEMILYTNRGLGTTWLRFRYNCPPEISLFTLHST